ncbi:MAG: LysM peptidoglycan-binding domain-containing protein [Planctomycetes bacterium]|nr:LysM peptidoglycan-binding domain-containing protein [Planctomycetota bacterium]
MGKFEKLVVLVVLFLLPRILVVSLNTDEPKTLAQASLGGVEEAVEVVEVEPAQPLVSWEALDVDELPEEEVGHSHPMEEEVLDTSTALLSGQVMEEAPLEAEFLLPEDLIGLPEGTILTQPVGLMETLDPNTFSIAVGEDDTYKSIALEYYGDEGYAGMIRQANDDPMTAPSAELVMLPAFDMRLQRRDRVGGKSHTVINGDTFTGIALRHYGNANLWKRIHEANKAKCPTPLDLRAGMTLVIP